MCLAAKTPSTIAQQKAATTPKLMKTMEATNWKERGGVEGERGALASSLFITLTCLYPSSPNMEHSDFPSAAGLFASWRLCGEGQQENTLVHRPLFSLPLISLTPPFFIFLNCHSKAYLVAQGHTLSAGWLERIQGPDSRWILCSMLQHLHQTSIRC